MFGSSGISGKYHDTNRILESIHTGGSEPPKTDIINFTPFRAKSIESVSAPSVSFPLLLEFQKEE